ncbi:MAG: hypothetical protein MHMPM18_002644 [Marteilia pararefringens]
MNNKSNADESGLTLIGSFFICDVYASENLLLLIDLYKLNPSKIRIIFTSDLKTYQKLQKHYRKGTNQKIYTVTCIKEQDSRKISQTINTNEVSLKDLSFVDMVYMIKELEKSTVNNMMNTIMTNY